MQKKRFFFFKYFFDVFFDRAPLQHIDSEAVEIGVNIPANRPARSNPMPMPPVALGRGIVPVLIESGSASMIFIRLLFRLKFVKNPFTQMTIFILI